MYVFYHTSNCHGMVIVIGSVIKVKTKTKNAIIPIIITTGINPTLNIILDVNQPIIQSTNIITAATRINKEIISIMLDYLRFFSSTTIM